MSFYYAVFMAKISKRLVRSKKRYLSYGDVPKPRRNEVIIGVNQDFLLDDLPFIGNSLRRGRPDWWEELPSEKGSFRRCYGINDLLANGWQIDAWCDFHIHVGDDHHGSPDDPIVHGPNHIFRTDQFDYSQVGKCPVTEHNLEGSHFPKLISPYYVRTPKHWSCLMIPSPFNYDPRYRVMPGVVHTDFFHDMHCALNVQARESFIITRGTPLFFVFPFRRDFKLSTVAAADRSIQVQMEQASFNINKFTRFPDQRGNWYKNLQRRMDSQPKSLIERILHRH